MLRTRWMRGVTPRLVGAAGIANDVALVVDGVFRPSFDARKLRGRRWLLPAQHVDCAGQLSELELERGDFPQLFFQLRLDLIQQFVARLPERLTEGRKEAAALNVEMAPEPALLAGPVLLISGWRGRRHRLRALQHVFVCAIFCRCNIPVDDTRR